jgi:hypothetical protein
LVPLTERALPSFDALTAGGVTATTRRSGPFLAVYRTEHEREGLLAELLHAQEAGHRDVAFATVMGAQARALEPVLITAAGAAALIWVSAT